MMLNKGQTRQGGELLTSLKKQYPGTPAAREADVLSQSLSVRADAIPTPPSKSIAANAPHPSVHKGRCQVRHWPVAAVGRPKDWAAMRNLPSATVVDRRSQFATIYPGTPTYTKIAYLE